MRDIESGWATRLKAGLLAGLFFWLLFGAFYAGTYPPQAQGDPFQSPIFCHPEAPGCDPLPPRPDDNEPDKADGKRFRQFLPSMFRPSALYFPSLFFSPIHR